MTEINGIPLTPDTGYLNSGEKKNVPRSKGYDILKVIAILIMIIDHIGAYIYVDYHVLRIIGRISAPIFFFLCGYSKSTKYDKKMFIYGIVLSIVAFTRVETFHFNILLTFMIIRTMNVNPSYIVLFSYPIIVMLLVIERYYGQIMIFEYGVSGIMMGCAGRLYRDYKNKYWFVVGPVVLYMLKQLVAIYGYFDGSHLFAPYIFLVLTAAVVSTLLIYYLKDEGNAFPYSNRWHEHVLTTFAGIAMQIYFYHYLVLLLLSKVMTTDLEKVVYLLKGGM